MATLRDFEVPDELKCPISHVIMEDPVILVDSGHTYDRSAIETWINQGILKDPISGNALRSLSMKSDVPLRNAIADFKELWKGSNWAPGSPNYEADYGEYYLEESSGNQEENETVRQLIRKADILLSKTFPIFKSRNQKRAMEFYTQAAAMDSAEAQHKLGRCFELSIGVNADWDRAFDLYRSAASLGHLAAQFDIGRCFFNGIGVKIDREAAVKWYSRAAYQGHPLSQVALGDCLYVGWGVVKDESMGELWVRRGINGIDLTDCIGACFVGNCFYYGIGVPVDDFKAARLFSFSASKGYAMGQFLLGQCYYYGSGVKRNDQVAVSLFLRASEKGCVESTYWLGVCYEYGRGVTKKLDVAKLYKEQAREAGL